MRLPAKHWPLTSRPHSLRAERLKYAFVETSKIGSFIRFLWHYVHIHFLAALVAMSAKQGGGGVPQPELRAPYWKTVRYHVFPECSGLWEAATDLLLPVKLDLFWTILRTCVLNIQCPTGSCALEFTVGLAPIRQSLSPVQLVDDERLSVVDMLPFASYRI